VLEARIARAQIVDGEAEAELEERVHRLAVKAEVLDDLVLGDLERDHLRLQLRPEIVEHAATEEARVAHRRRQRVDEQSRGRAEEHPVGERLPPTAPLELLAES